MTETKKFKIYFASPFFNPEQVEREERLKAKLRELGFEVYSPKEACHLKMDATIEEQQKVVDDNLINIFTADIVFAVTDGKDVGTIWEAGFANGLNYYGSKFNGLQTQYDKTDTEAKYLYGTQKIIVYYCETLPPGAKFNVMLARSADLVYTKYEDLCNNFKQDIDNYLEDGSKVIYTGNIE